MNHRTDHTRAHWALTGALAAAAALATGHLAAAVLTARSAPVSAIADIVIAASPQGLVAWAIDTFGTADKPLLIIGVTAATLAVGALAGLTWRTRPALGAAIVAALGLIGAAAAVTRPGIGPLGAIPSLIAAATAAAVLLARSRPARTDPGGRRRFLATVAAATVGALAAGWIARRLLPAAEADRAALDLPDPDQPALPLGPDADFDIDGLTPRLVPNSDFYRIDTAITAPAVDRDQWRLRITGMVDRTREYTFDDLLGRELIERDLTLCCVSNPVGGDLVGTARWLGIALADLLADAGPDPDADQLVSRSVDGWTAGTPTAAVLDGRDALVAIGMNGEPLPIDHGWPARLVIPGFYGYVSATKWVTELELTTFDAYDAYWIRRDWARPGPVRTASRIDVPRPRATLDPGPTVIAGVAWAQQRGINAVDVAIDGGPWRPAELSDTANGDTWRQWRLDWDADPGDHTITVRATDGDDNLQTATRTPVKPAGATGLHSVAVTIR